MLLRTGFCGDQWTIRLRSDLGMCIPQSFRADLGMCIPQRLRTALCGIQLCREQYMYEVCLLNSRKTSIKIKQLKIEPRLILAYVFMFYVFRSALTIAGAPRRRSPVQHFSYPLLLLLGGLLIEAEAGEIPFRPWAIHQQWERCPRWLKSHSDHRWDHLSRSGLLLLCSLVKQFDRQPGWLLENDKLLWRVALTVLADTSWSWASFMTLSLRLFSISAVIPGMDTVAVRFLWSAASAGLPPILPLDIRLQLRSRLSLVMVDLLDNFLDLMKIFLAVTSASMTSL